MTTDDFIRDLLILDAMLTQGDPFSAGDSLTDCAINSALCGDDTLAAVLLSIGEYTLSDGSKLGFKNGRIVSDTHLIRSNAAEGVAARIAKFLTD